MDRTLFELQYRLEHRHKDGSWAEMVEDLRRTVPGKVGQRLIERGIGLAEDGGGDGGGLGEHLAHPDRLRPLAGEDEGVRVHPDETTRTGPVHAGRPVRDCTESRDAGILR